MSTLNGQKSIFRTPPAPVLAEESTPLQPATVDIETHFQNQVDDAIHFARQLQAWLADEQAQAERQAWSEACRKSEPLPTDAEKRAEAYELAKLGDGALYCINGSDIKWQQGGS